MNAPVYVRMQQTPAIFIAGNPALDFLNSIATPVDIPIEWLDSGDGLLSWLDQARLVPATALRQLRSQFSVDELDEAAQQARHLREWFRGFVERHQGRPLAREDFNKLEPLNRLLEQDDAFNQIASAQGKKGNAFELRVARKWDKPETLLMPIAQALARLICSENFTYVKACEGPACTLVFIDKTRARARRWCSMAICGNRAKQAAHRQRVKESH